jgi:hypothetical protein
LSLKPEIVSVEDHGFKNTIDLGPARINDMNQSKVFAFGAQGRGGTHRREHHTQLPASGGDWPDNRICLRADPKVESSLPSPLCRHHLGLKKANTI